MFGIKRRLKWLEQRMEDLWRIRAERCTLCGKAGVALKMVSVPVHTWECWDVSYRCGAVVAHPECLAGTEYDRRKASVETTPTVEWTSKLGGSSSSSVSRKNDRPCISAMASSARSRPKLEAGCKVRGQGRKGEHEVAAIVGHTAVTSIGEVCISDPRWLKVTQPATPEAEDCVFVHGWGVLGTVGTQRNDGWWNIWACGTSAPQPRAAFTIIAKARHVKAAMADRA